MLILAKKINFQSAIIGVNLRFNRKLPILGYPLLDGRQSAPV